MSLTWLATPLTPCFICDSFEDFVTLVNMRRCAPNPKYELIVKEHFAREEAFAAKVQEYFTVEDDPDVCE